MKLSKSYSSIICLFISLNFCSGQVVESDKGKSEFIGLKNWNIKMIQDSLEVYAPNGNGLWGCAAELVAKLHFADASVIRYKEDTSFISIITVVEPEDIANTQYKASMAGTYPILPEYQIAESFFRKDYMAFQAGLINYGQFLKGNADSLKIKLHDQGDDLSAIAKVWDFLQSRKNNKEKVNAIWISQNNPNPVNRAIAAAILANFPDDDLCWWTLMDVLRDKDIFVNGTARQSLAVLIKLSQKKIDWSPCVPTLRCLLSGTNLFAYNTVLNVLQKTAISPELADKLLSESASYLLLSYLKAHHNNEKQLAYGLLKQLSGKDFGSDITSWQQWIDGLKI
jgi:hypothetical protein